MATNGDAVDEDQGRPLGARDPPDALSTFTGYEVSSIDTHPENCMVPFSSLPAQTSEQTELNANNEYALIRRDTSSSQGLDPEGIDSSSLSSLQSRTRQSRSSSDQSQSSRRSRRSLEPPDSLSRIIVETASSENSNQNTLIREFQQAEAR